MWPSADDRWCRWIVFSSGGPALLALPSPLDPWSWDGDVIPIVGETADAPFIGECGAFMISDCGAREGKCRPRPGVDVVYSDRIEDPVPGETDFVPPDAVLLCGAIADVEFCLHDTKDDELQDPTSASWLREDGTSERHLQ